MKNSEEQKLLSITLDKILSIVDHNKRLYKKNITKNQDFINALKLSKCFLEKISF